MGDLLAGTPATMMAFTADAPTVNGSGGGLQGAMEESEAFRSAHEQAFTRLQTFIAETNTRVARHIDVAKGAGRSYLETDEVSAANLSIADFKRPR
ncbi:hypothetical protein [Actinophytocola sp. NPDC049390]|uniref:hypothetical protein n=1 Tax=Actinophytocola sp. NPDC049390 TaxID=3363894 RepID=UPI0037B78C1A